MSHLFVINPVSGDLDKALIRDQIDLKFDGHDFYYTSGSNDKLLLGQKILDLSPQKIITVGGDGTVLLVAETLQDIDKKIPIGIIPGGSANGLSRDLEIPSAVESAIEKILKSESSIGLDLIKINDEYHCIHIGDAGINARIVRDYANDERRGLFTYAKYFFEELSKAEPFKAKIITDSRSFETEGYMFAIANSMRYGTGVKINYVSDATDGLFEISILKEKGISTLLKAGLSALNIDFEEGNDQETISCKSAKIQFSHPVMFQVDGELVGKVSELEAKILESAIEVIV
jgi:YegS/Rv2252/BmrU family lipid kinase